MKRIALMVGCMLMVVHYAVAQVPSVPPPNTYSLQFDSQHGEAYSVFIDGELQNRLPQGRVIVNEVSDKTHEVVVVLKRPAEKCAVLQLRPKDRNVLININYDNRLEQLYLYTAAHNRADYEATTLSRARISVPDKGAELPVPERVVKSKGDSVLADEDVLSSMVLQLKSQSFERDRLSLAKVFVGSTILNCEQLKRLAETLDFSNTRVDFLKYAYPYCLDPENYYRTVDVLTFTADKKKVLDYVATQK